MINHLCSEPGYESFSTVSAMDWKAIEKDDEHLTLCGKVVPGKNNYISAPRYIIYLQRRGGNGRSAEFTVCPDCLNHPRYSEVMGLQLLAEID